MLIALGNASANLFVLNFVRLHAHPAVFRYIMLGPQVQIFLRSFWMQRFCWCTVHWRNPCQFSSPATHEAQKAVPRKDDLLRARLVRVIDMRPHRTGWCSFAAPDRLGRCSSWGGLNSSRRQDRAVPSRLADLGRLVAGRPSFVFSSMPSRLSDEAVVCAVGGEPVFGRHFCWARPLSQHACRSIRRR